jgi:hypothetical protein
MDPCATLSPQVIQRNEYSRAYKLISSNRLIGEMVVWFDSWQELAGEGGRNLKRSYKNPQSVYST